jgi:hypothetical protein
MLLFATLSQVSLLQVNSLFSHLLLVHIVGDQIIPDLQILGPLLHLGYRYIQTYTRRHVLSSH